jgi:hypothetical protein
MQAIATKGQNDLDKPLRSVARPSSSSYKIGRAGHLLEGLHSLGPARLCYVHGAWLVRASSTT